MAPPPDHALLFPPTVTTLLCAFLVQNSYNCFQNKTKVTRANVLLWFLPLFCAYFSLQTCRWGLNNIFCPLGQGTLAMLLEG